MAAFCSQASVEDMDRLTALVLALGEVLEEEDIKKIKFSLSGKITKKNLERSQDMIDIFSRLKEKELVSTEDISLLREKVLQATNKSPKIVKIFEQYDAPSTGEPGTRQGDILKAQVTPARTEQRTHHRYARSDGAQSFQQNASNISSRRSEVSSPIPERFREQFKHTAANLGDDWQVLARLIGMKDMEIDNIVQAHYGNIHMQAHAVLKIWLNRQTQPSSKVFRNLLRRIPRNDIADDLKVMTSKSGSISSSFSVVNSGASNT